MHLASSQEGSKSDGRRERRADVLALKCRMRRTGRHWNKKHFSIQELWAREKKKIEGRWLEDRDVNIRECESDRGATARLFPAYVRGP